MSDRRNIVEEILEIRGRRKSDIPQSELFLRLLHVEHAYQERDPENKELLRYFPIAVVACMETYFRLAIKKLIDSGEPYLTNSQALMPKANVGFDVLRALHGQSITIGDVISHSVSISNLTHLASDMSKLMGVDFLKEVSLIHDRWAVEVLKQPVRPILLEADNTFRYVARTFELRHIFCHETASNHQFDAEEIEKCFDNAVLFLKAAEEMVSETLYPNSPLTQSDMNIASAGEYRKEKEHLDVLLSRVESLLSDKQVPRFNEANKAWEAFSEASVEVEGLQYEGGSIRPTVENSAATRLTRERSAQVSKLVDLLQGPQNWGLTRLIQPTQNRAIDKRR
jgi:uncharacterized protein YecT (DUF1311 family)